MRRAFQFASLLRLLLLVSICQGLFPALLRASPVELIARGSDWSYWDIGGTPPAQFPFAPSWTSRFYDDSAWASGPAQFGYGEGDEATILNFGPDPDTKYITTYFRRFFNVTNAADFNQLALGILRDDGVVVYLNGVEIYRNNMPTGSIDSGTFASTNVAAIAERTFFPAT